MSWSTDGGGSQIRHNFVESGPKRRQGDMYHLLMGLYIDNYCSNFIVHHNIVMGGHTGLATNLPNPGTVFANNTVIGAHNGYGLFSVSKDNADGTGVGFFNNLFIDISGTDISYYGTENGSLKSYIGNFIDGTVPVPVNPEVRIDSSNNMRGEVDGNFNPVKNSPAIDGGIYIEGITGQFSGQSPYVGALDYGQPMFEYGASRTKN